MESRSRWPTRSDLAAPGIFGELAELCAEVKPPAAPPRLRWELGTELHVRARRSGSKQESAGGFPASLGVAWYSAVPRSDHDNTPTGVMLLFYPRLRHVRSATYPATRLLKTAGGVDSAAASSRGGHPQTNSIKRLRMEPLCGSPKGRYRGAGSRPQRAAALDLAAPAMIVLIFREHTGAVLQQVPHWIASGSANSAAADM